MVCQNLAKVQLDSSVISLLVHFQNQASLRHEDAERRPDHEPRLVHQRLLRVIAEPCSFVRRLVLHARPATA